MFRRHVKRRCSGKQVQKPCIERHSQEICSEGTLTRHDQKTCLENVLRTQAQKVYQKDMFTRLAQKTGLFSLIFNYEGGELADSKNDLGDH